MKDMKNISYIGLWICLGMIFDSVFNNLVIGVGIIIGSGLDRLNSKNQNYDTKDKIDKN